MTLVELLIVLLVTSILAGIAAPSYQRSIHQTRATRIVGDCQAVRAAAQMYRMDTHDWPADADAGVAPRELAPYLAGTEFEGTGYELDWDRWELDDGTLVAISVVVEDPALEAAVLSVFRTLAPTWRLENRYTLQIDGPMAAAEESEEDSVDDGPGVGGGVGGGRWLNRGQGRGQGRGPNP